MSNPSTRKLKGTALSIIGDGPEPLVPNILELPSSGELIKIQGTIHYRENAKVHGLVRIDRQFIFGSSPASSEPEASRFELEISAEVRGNINFRTSRQVPTIPGTLSVFVQRTINGSLEVADHTRGGQADKQVFITSSISVPLVVQFFDNANQVGFFDLTIGPNSSKLVADEEHHHLYLWDREVDGVRHVHVRGIAAQ